MSWKSFACLTAIAALAAPAVAQPTIGLEDRGDNIAALTITTDTDSAFGTSIQVDFTGLSLVGTPTLSVADILDPDGNGIDNNPFENLDGTAGSTSGLAVDSGSIFASLGLGAQGVRTFDLFTFEFDGFGTIDATGLIGQDIGGGAANFNVSASLEIADADVLLGDANGDGVVNAADINPFVLALTNPTQFAVDFPSVSIVPDLDTNSDGAFNAGDINPFVGILTSSSIAAVPEPSLP